MGKNTNDRDILKYESVLKQATEKCMRHIKATPTILIKSKVTQGYIKGILHKEVKIETTNDRTGR